VTASNKIVRPIFFGKGLDKIEEIQQAAQTVRDELKLIDKRLADSQWLVDNKISGAADIGVCAQRPKKPPNRSRFPSTCAPVFPHCPMGTAHRSVAELPAYISTALAIVFFKVAGP